MGESGPEEAARELLEGADDLPMYPRLPRRRPTAGRAQSLKTGVSVGTSGREVKKATQIRGAPRAACFQGFFAPFCAAAGWGSAGWVVKKCRPHLGQTQN